MNARCGVQWLQTYIMRNGTAAVPYRIESTQVDLVLSDSPESPAYLDAVVSTAGA